MRESIKYFIDKRASSKTAILVVFFYDHFDEGPILRNV